MNKSAGRIIFLLCRNFHLGLIIEGGKKSGHGWG